MFKRSSQSLSSPDVKEDWKLENKAAAEQLDQLSPQEPFKGFHRNPSAPSEAGPDLQPPRSASADLQTWDSWRTGSVTAEGAVGSGLNSGNVPELFCSHDRERPEKTRSGRERSESWRTSRDLQERARPAPASAAGTIRGL